MRYSKDEGLRLVELDAAGSWPLLKVEVEDEVERLRAFEPVALAPDSIEDDLFSF